MVIDTFMSHSLLWRMSNYMYIAVHGTFRQTSWANPGTGLGTGLSVMVTEPPGPERKEFAGDTFIDTTGIADAGFFQPDFRDTRMRT